MQFTHTWQLVIKRFLLTGWWSHFFSRWIVFLIFLWGNWSDILYIQNKTKLLHNNIEGTIFFFFDHMVTKSIFTIVSPDINFNHISKHNVVLIRHRILMNLCNLLRKGTNKVDKSHIFMVFKESIPTNNNNFIITNPKTKQKSTIGIRKTVNRKVKWVNELSEYLFH